MVLLDWHASWIDGIQWGAMLRGLSKCRSETKQADVISPWIPESEIVRSPVCSLKGGDDLVNDRNEGWVFWTFKKIHLNTATLLPEWGFPWMASS